MWYRDDRYNKSLSFSRDNVLRWSYTSHNTKHKNAFNFTFSSLKENFYTPHLGWCLYSIWTTTKHSFVFEIPNFHLRIQYFLYVLLIFFFFKFGELKVNEKPAVCVRNAVPQNFYLLKTNNCEFNPTFISNLFLKDERCCIQSMML